MNRSTRRGFWRFLSALPFCAFPAFGSPARLFRNGDKGLSPLGAEMVAGLSDFHDAIKADKALLGYITSPPKSGPCECVPGDLVVLEGLPRGVHAAILNAFVNRKKDHKTGDVTVKLECLAAQQLMFALATSMRTNFIHREDQ